MFRYDQVCIHGAQLAYLLSTLSTASSQVEGFILGTIEQSHTVTTPTDHNAASSRSSEDSSPPSTTEKLLSATVHEFVITGRCCSFYDRGGRVDLRRVQHLLVGQTALIGWFRYRREAPLSLGVREREVHTRLEAYYGVIESRVGVPLLAALFTRSVDVQQALKLDYRVLQRGTQMRVASFTEPLSPMLPVSIRVINLKTGSRTEYDQHYGGTSWSPHQLVASSSPAQSTLSHAPSQTSHTPPAPAATTALDHAASLTSSLTQLDALMHECALRGELASHVGEPIPAHVLELETVFRRSLDLLSTKAAVVHQSNAEVLRLQRELAQRSSSAASSATSSAVSSATSSSLAAARSSTALSASSSSLFSST